MKITQLISVNHRTSYLKSGDVYDLPDNEARYLIKLGLANASEIYQKNDSDGDTSYSEPTQATPENAGRTKKRRRSAK